MIFFFEKKNLWSIYGEKERKKEKEREEVLEKSQEKDGSPTPSFFFPMHTNKRETEKRNGERKEREKQTLMLSSKARILMNPYQCSSKKK